MTLVNIVFGNPFVLDKFDLRFLIFLLSIFQPFENVYQTQFGEGSRGHTLD
jgi:hypothetical protein